MIISNDSQILGLLEELEADNDISIIYACEAGSRVWGFESDDSDYDVRFIYIKPLENYLRLDSCSQSDTITSKRGLIDCHGWDLKKALYLYWKSNPSLYEWLLSTTIYKVVSVESALYRCYGFMVNELPNYYDPITLYNHHSGMAESHYQRYIEGLDEVLIKKLLYVVRSLLSAVFIYRERQLPPISIQQLLEQIDMAETDYARDEIAVLLELKATSEQTTANVKDFEHVTDWIEFWLKWDKTIKGNPKKGDFDKLSNLFINLVLHKQIQG